MMVRHAIQGPVGTVVDIVKTTLDKCPPELAGDIMDRGIALTGGGALLRGLDERLREETGMPIHLADNPLESASATPPVSTWAVLNRLVTASTAPAKLCGRLIAAATSRAMHSASTLSEWSIISDSRCTNGADCTTASCRAPDGAEAIVTAAGSRPRALASSRPASSAGVLDRRELTEVGWMRPASATSSGSIMTRMH